MGWLIAAGVLALLACLPLGVRARYQTQGPKLWLLIGFFRLQVLPSKGDKEDKPKEKQENNDKKEEPSNKAKKSGGKLTDFLPIARIVWELLKDFGRKLRVSNLIVDIVMAGEDPCDLAQNYGKVCSAVSALEPQLDRFLVIKSKQIRIDCDFMETSSKIYANIDITITLGRLLYLLMRYGTRVLREYSKLKKIGKGGA